MAELNRIAQHGLSGEFRLNEPMEKHVSWRAGGSADRAYVPRDLNDLGRFLRTVPKDEPIWFVGLGSNLLVRDGGLRGTVVFTHGSLNALRCESAVDGATLIYVEAGVASPKVARFAATHGFGGAEFLAGIPGTIGGALAMNAGCYGSQMWEIVDNVLCTRRDGNSVQRYPSEYEISYRHVALRADAADFGVDEWFTGAWLRLAPADGEESRRIIKELLQRRISSQPLSQPNAGSVFRNPRGDYAARLIESCGMKGLTIGGAMVSPKHANFIVNVGEASAADIEKLIDRVQQTVWESCGVQLEREVRIVGERA